MKTIDIVAALILLGLSALVAVETWGLPYWSTFAPGPAFASLWIAAAGAVIGLALLVQALLSKGGAPAEWPGVVGARQVASGAGALWLMLAMLPWFGTAISGLVFMLLFLLAIARRPALPSIVTSVATVAMTEIVFGVWLHIDLPKGVVGF